MKTPRNQGFTLIELLVVITIIAILASIAVPVYNGITIRAEQTKALSNAKQIALACKIFAIDNDGIFPDTEGVGTGSLDRDSYAAGGGSPDSAATKNFGALIGGGYLPSESIFWISKERNGTARLVRPDDDISSGTDGVALASNAWGYTAGADDGSSASLPLVYTRSATAGVWPYKDQTKEGGVWTDKIIVVSTDYAGQVVKLLSTGSTGVANTASGNNMFTDTSIWGTGTAFTICNN